MSARARKALAYGAAFGVVAMTMHFVTDPWEGERTKAYWDSLGKKWTICSGDTLDVRPGMTLTKPQCDKRDMVRMERDYHKPLQACVTKFDTMPLGLQGSMLDEAWNIGVYTMCHSTAAERARRHDYAGACEASTWYDKASGKVIAGLQRRRTFGDKDRIGEYELCIESVRQAGK